MLKTFAVIGDPIDHSLSPTIHNAAYRELEMECTYIAYRVAQGELATGIESLKKINIAGFNVTIPHKIEMMRYLDNLDDNCKKIGAVNTVLNDDGILRGFNTDMDGFLEPIKRKEIEIKNSRILILGAGGAARAIIAGFQKENAKEITIVNRTKSKGDELSEFSNRMGLSSVSSSIKDMEDFDSQFDMIVNASSLGLKGEKNIIPSRLFDEQTTVYDIVYKPIKTDLINTAKERKSRIIFGYEMLLGQAIRSFEIWLDRQAPYDAMKRAILGGF
ncbi:MAG: shikimate dehydrogenase [Candidatus Nitrosopelagicus sp.]|nr:shikimate dehydrogenase [Candidatus Nitrosopelagicus sp.]